MKTKNSAPVRRAVALLGPVAALVTVSAFVFSLAQQVSYIGSTRDDVDRLMYQVRELSERVSQLGDLRTPGDSPSLVPPPALAVPPPASAEDDQEWKVEARRLRNELAEVQRVATSLREAINPKNPEEVLRVARLGDRINLLAADLDRLRDDHKRSHEEFVATVRRELDARDRSTTTILIVLFPLILNFLYQLWKDRRQFLDRKDTAREQEV